MRNNHTTKNIETTICKNCGSLFKRRKKPVQGSKSTKKGVRGKGYVTCSKKCSREWSRLMCKSGERKRKEQEYKVKLEKLNKMGVVNL